MVVAHIYPVFFSFHTTCWLTLLKAHPPGHELLWTISRLVRGVLIKIHVSRCLSNICDANLSNNWNLNVCVWGERMFYESNESMSHESMSQWVRSEKIKVSVYRNNKIKHYFYLVFVHLLHCCLHMQGVFLTWNLNLGCLLAIFHALPLLLRACPKK